MAKLSDRSVIVTAGSKAPPFELPASSGAPVSLKELTAAGPAVLFFYPKADTPGCTTEACAFRDASAEFAKLKVSIVGISPDPVKRVTRFAKKFNLGYPLLADADHAVADAYGVWQQKLMFGRAYMGVVRTTFVVGKHGKVLHVFYDVTPAGHEGEVLRWLTEKL